MRFTVGQVALEQILHRHFGFAPAVSLHYCSIIISRTCSSCHKKRLAKRGNLSKSNALSEARQLWTEKYFHVCTHAHTHRVSLSVTFCLLNVFGCISWPTVPYHYISWTLKKGIIFWNLLYTAGVRWLCPVPSCPVGHKFQREYGGVKGKGGGRMG